MAVVDRKSVLSGLKVSEAMRRIVAQISRESSIEQAIRTLIKFRANALLVTDQHRNAVGVVSKTNVMGAYYAGLPLATGIEAIMIPDPIFCQKESSLEPALDTMRSARIHRLYVHDDQPGMAVGVLAYQDILGLLYRYCHKCERNILRLRDSRAAAGDPERLRVSEAMTPSVMGHEEHSTLYEIMEGLESAQAGASLIRQQNGRPVGVVSKTDLLLAYLHEVSPESTAQSIMSRPIRSCAHDEFLHLAIQQMIFTDLQRLFVHRDHPENLVGVLSLSDAARMRSGSCRACTASRIEVESGSY